MSVRVVWRGAETKRAVRAAAGQALYAAAEYLLQKSNEVCPIDESILINSSRVSVDVPNRVAAVSYDTVYACRQHEELGWRHAPGRHAKYLENTVRIRGPEAARILHAHMMRALQ